MLDRDPEDGELRQLLRASQRYVAFLDVLGYRHIVEGSDDDVRKFRILHSIFDTFLVSFSVALHDHNTTAAQGETLKAASFSDSLYVAGRDLASLLAFLQTILGTAYGLQQRTYRDEPDAWVPFIRTGVAFGWVVDFRSLSSPALAERDAFRNPVGPAVAAAYTLTECTGKLPGMRCFMESHFLGELRGLVHLDSPGAYRLHVGGGELLLLDVPAAESPGKDLVEVAWPCSVIRGNNVDFFEPLVAVRRQFNSASAKHYNGTARLMDRSVNHCGDDVAREQWCKRAGLERLLMPENQASVSS